MKRYPYFHASVRLTGRWAETETTATATAVGSSFEVAFTGRFLHLHFDTKGCVHPYPHLWIAVDGGARTESVLAPVISVDAQTDGAHHVRVIYKSANEAHARWEMPLAGKVIFCGYTAKKAGELAPDNRPIIEFVGDSITEGILVAGDIPAVYPNRKDNCVIWDDTCGTYAWQIAEALNLRPIIMGYGSVGVTKGGNGGVPAAAEAYPYAYAGTPVDTNPDIVMINHGANDRCAEPAAYLAAYRNLIDLIREKHPDAKLVCMSAFCGFCHKELGEMIAAYNKAHCTNILFIDSHGWLPTEPLHPLREGHTKVAAHVVPILRAFFAL